MASNATGTAGGGGGGWIVIPLHDYAKRQGYCKKIHRVTRTANRPFYRRMLPVFVDDQLSPCNYLARCSSEHPSKRASSFERHWRDTTIRKKLVFPWNCRTFHFLLLSFLIIILIILEWASFHCFFVWESYNGKLPYTSYWILLRPYDS